MKTLLLVPALLLVISSSFAEEALVHEEDTQEIAAVANDPLDEILADEEDIDTGSTVGNGAPMTPAEDTTL